MPSRTLGFRSPYQKLFQKPSELQSLWDSTSSATLPCPSTMLPVLTDAQLQVILPISSSSPPDNDTRQPSHFRLAASQPHWQQTMKEEIDALIVQGTWFLVTTPNRNIVGSKWIYKVKKNPDGFVSRYKAWLVAQGSSQEQGLDYDETFNLVVRHTTVISLCCSKSLGVRRLDVKNAFLRGDLQEEVYMKQTQGFEDAIRPSHVYKLLKSLYSLKQAPRAWNAKFPVLFLLWVSLYPILIRVYLLSIHTLTSFFSFFMWMTLSSLVPLLH
ncbi:hypothetical protein L3X38_041714 [Prunus dulcis]|uniref:Reverse transcriptase Ty1/copia-type domain-containing protein n=1 Tax=Prunus dulcis TaxID=3755 RepID=A0AAD4UV88_PRUDU|nr:hypothetical protein L3X38_041714 [Prunus dulcis]